MSFIEKIKTGLTGKTAEQRANDRLATSIASRQIQKAAFEERSRQMTRVAVEKEKLRAENMLKKERDRYNRPAGSSIVGGFASSFKGTSSPVGGASMLNAFGNPTQKSQATYNPISGVWGSTGGISKPRVVRRVKHRRARPRRARRIVYVRKYV